MKGGTTTVYISVNVFFPKRLNDVVDIYQFGHFLIRIIRLR